MSLQNDIIDEFSSILSHIPLHNFRFVFPVFHTKNCMHYSTSTVFVSCIFELQTVHKFVTLFKAPVKNKMYCLKVLFLFAFIYVISKFYISQFSQFIICHFNDEITILKFCTMQSTMLIHTDAHFAGSGSLKPLHIYAYFKFGLLNQSKRGFHCRFPWTSYTVFSVSCFLLFLWMHECQFQSH